jgi:hypothetical protein
LETKMPSHSVGTQQQGTGRDYSSMRSC